MVREFSLFTSIKFIKRLTYLSAGLAVVVLLFSFIYYIAFNWFCVDHIVINGNINKVTASQIADIANKEVKGTLFTLNIEKLRAEFKNVPWVKNVIVLRQFPSSIVINVTGYNAVAKFGDEGYFVSQDGEVFFGVNNHGLILPTFYVPSSDLAATIKTYAQIKNVFIKHQVILNQISWLAPNITKLTFSNGLEVVICGTNILDKMLFLNYYWDQLYKLNPELHAINMCYKNKVAINEIVHVHK